jgi:hypothetical protein
MKFIAKRTYEVEILDPKGVCENSEHLQNVMDASTRAADMGDHMGWVYAFEVPKDDTVTIQWTLERGEFPNQEPNAQIPYMVREHGYIIEVIE